MKRSKQVALWITGSMVMSGCHQTAGGGWGFGRPMVDGTNQAQRTYVGGHSSGSWWSGGGGHGWFGGGEMGGVSRGGFGFHGGGGHGGGGE